MVKTTKRNYLIGTIMAFVLIMGSVAMSASMLYAKNAIGDDPTIWLCEQGIQHRYLHPRTRQPITPEERAGLRSWIVEKVPVHRPVMDYIPQGATETQIWLVERFAGLCARTEPFENPVPVELAVDLVFSYAVEQFDRFFGRGAAFATMSSPEFRILFTLLGHEMFYAIIEAEDFMDLLGSVLGESVITAMSRLPIYPPSGSNVWGTRLHRLEVHLKAFANSLSAEIYLA